MLAAVIANTSGTGGGVVFVPVFNALREHGVMTLDPLRVTAASMAIQSFGMTIGGLRWTDRLLHQPVTAVSSGQAAVRPRDYALVIGAVLALALPALWAMQRLTIVDGHMILLGYKAFSIFLGLALIITTWTINHKRPERARLEPVDIAVLLLIAIPGGALTGAFLARPIALWLGAKRLKTLDGTWIVLSAVYLIGLNWVG